MVFGGAAVRTKTENNAEVDLKIDIINTYEEDIIASKTFSGRSVLVGKERANVLDGITGSQIFSAGSTADQSRIAFYDTIDKIVEFLDDKME
jgi:curli biogenesis system outer membrane secretion channel CsgG